ncbi:hypothetical protein TNCV_3518621 [Trichonephila clavipes]|uniref:Uncharacterized protein n=1 Tax=Trichonephila clavipes TaxID=2585209 RepID=A0A8X6SPE3_TRICX|nr:hypothetical protein TNCV_3518621 [Trichonephila clavipes]
MRPGPTVQIPVYVTIGVKYRLTTSSVGYSSSSVLWRRWSPSILGWMQSGRSRQQPGQAIGGILPNSHIWWLGESGQQPRLSPGSPGLDPQWPEFPMAFQGS